MGETDTSTVAPGSPTDKGKETGTAGTDPVVSGLSKRLNQEKARADAAEAKLADQALIVEEATKTKRENSALKKSRQYADVAGTLETLFAKGFDPDVVDDDFVKALRGTAPVSKDEGAIETPTHSTTRTVTGTTPDEAMKRMTAEELWGS